jgi:hypothetical protein
LGAIYYLRRVGSAGLSQLADYLGMSDSVWRSRIIRMAGYKVLATTSGSQWEGGPDAAEGVITWVRGGSFGHSRVRSGRGKVWMDHE